MSVVDQSKTNQVILWGIILQLNSVTKCNNQLLHSRQINWKVYKLSLNTGYWIYL